MADEPARPPLYALNKLSHNFQFNDIRYFSMKDKKLLITGATGQLAYSIAQKLAKENNVHAIAHLYIDVITDLDVIDATLSVAPLLDPCRRLSSDVEPKGRRHSEARRKEKEREVCRDDLERGSLASQLGRGWRHDSYCFLMNRTEGGLEVRRG